MHMYIYIYIYIYMYIYIYIYKLQMNMTFGIFLLLCWITRRRKGKVKLVGHSMGFLRRNVAYTTELNRIRDDAPPL